MNDPEVYECKHCFSIINKKANVCSDCGKHQIGFSGYIDKYSSIFTFILVPIIASIALILSYLQYSQAAEERAKAEAAASVAEESMNLSLTSLQTTKEILELYGKRELSLGGDKLKESIPSLIEKIEKLENHQKQINDRMKSF